MAIVPKRKHSQARRDKRRSNVWKLEAPTLVKCPQCGELKVPHKVCGKCGYYKGQEVIKIIVVPNKIVNIVAKAAAA